MVDRPGFAGLIGGELRSPLGDPPPGSSVADHRPRVVEQAGLGCLQRRDSVGKHG